MSRVIAGIDVFRPALGRESAVIVIVMLYLHKNNDAFSVDFVSDFLPGSQLSLHNEIYDIGTEIRSSCCLVNFSPSIQTTLGLTKPKF